jgi:hypothetical protein
MPIDTLEIPSSLTNYTAKKEYVVDIAPGQINYNNIQFNSFAWGSNALQVTIPAGQALLRAAHFNLTGALNFTSSGHVGADGGNNAVPGPELNMGFAANPFWAICNNIQITIGNITTSYNSVKNMIDVLTRVKRSISVAYDSYSGDAVINDNCTAFLGMAGTNMNTLGNYYTQGFSEFVAPRTAHLRIIPTVSGDIAANQAYGPIAFSVLFSINIPLFWGVFTGSDNDQLAMARVNNVLINMSLDTSPLGLLAACFNFPADRVPSQVYAESFAYTGYNQQQTNLSLNYRTCQVDESITPLQTFNTFQTYYQTYAAQQTAAAYTSTTVNVPQISFSTTPSLIMLAVRPIFANRVAVSVDIPTFGPQYYCPINGANLNFGKNNALVIPTVQNVSDYWCYQLSRKNGLEQQFAEYAGRQGTPLYDPGNTLQTGSVDGLSGGFLVLTPADLQYSRDVTEAPGTIPQGNQLVLSGTLSYYSTTPGAGPAVELVVLVIYPQLFNEISPGNFEVRSYNPSEGTIVKVDSVMTDTRELAQRAAAYGGGFFSNLKGLAKKGLDLAVKNSDKIFNAAKSVLPEKYSGAIDKIEKYSDKLKNLYEKSGSGIGGRRDDKRQQLIAMVEEMEEDGVPQYEIEKLVARYIEQGTTVPTREEPESTGAGVVVDRKQLIDNSSKTIKSRLLQFL